MVADWLVRKASELTAVILPAFSSHLSLLRAKYLLATTAGLRRSDVPHNTHMMLQ